MIDMTPFPMTDREIAELSCKGHEEEVIKDGENQIAWLRCKHCLKVMSETVDLALLNRRAYDAWK